MTAALPFPNRRYGIIYADPCWTFQTYSEKGKGRSPEQHYACMSLNDISALPVADISAEDCVLFLWATFPMLPQALSVMERWGFAYKTVAFTWAKRTKTDSGWHFGNGYWTRANAEVVLLGTRGHPKRVDKGVRQLVVAPVGAHSAKPPEVRDRIVKLMGDVPRIELFARGRIPDGWDSWGLEAEVRGPPDLYTASS